MTNAEVDRIVVEVDVLCELARTSVASYMPIGLGPHWAREQRALLELLTDVPRRFAAAMVLAKRKHGWPEHEP